MLAIFARNSIRFKHKINKIISAIVLIALKFIINNILLTKLFVKSEASAKLATKTHYVFYVNNLHIYKIQNNKLYINTH